MLSNAQVIQNFEIQEILKKYPKSGQKQVFLVNHGSFGKVILKIVEGKDVRVEREIEIVTQNHFEYVPKVLKMDSYDINDENGIYVFEEYIEGSTLREVLNKGKVSLKEALNLAGSILTIIVQMEKNEVVHRDIKPENIIRGRDGNWYLIDFGIARVLNLSSLTLTEARVGPHTPGYGAPELFQYSKNDIDSRADIFSLGVVLFEALTGKHPFINGDEMNVNEVWYNTVTIMPESVVIDGDVDMQFMGLIETFMQKHITRRPKTAIKAMEWYKSVREHIEEGE